MQFVERYRWIPGLKVEYHLGLDGIGLAMVALSALVVPMALLVSERLANSRFCALILFLQAGLFGTFTALNFFHWFLFWELSLVPAYLLVRFWGGAGAGEQSNQFLIYTLVGSVAMLLGFLALYLGVGTWDFQELAQLSASGELTERLAGTLSWTSPESLLRWVFLGVFLGLAVKIPLFPFHTWLPGTYQVASTGVTLLLTAALSKMGVYVCLRILLPIFCDQLREMMTPLLVIAVATILLSALAALVQTDLKRLLAYSSVNHLGYCFLAVLAVAQGTGQGVTAELDQWSAVNGVAFQMVHHGIAAATLFAFVGFLESRSGGRTGLHDFGGLRQVAPWFCGLMGVAVFASLGLPGLSGFIGEFLIFKAAFALLTPAAVLSSLGLLLTAVFMLRLWQKIFYGPLAEKCQGFGDLSLKERCLAVPAAGLLIVLGVCPQLLISRLNQAVLQLVEGL